MLQRSKLKDLVDDYMAGRAHRAVSEMSPFNVNIFVWDEIGVVADATALAETTRDQVWGYENPYGWRLR